MKGIHPILSFTLLVVITLAIAVIVSGWLFNFFRTQSGNIQQGTEDQLRCQNAALYIKNVSYNCANDCSEGIYHNLTVTVVNSGKIKLFIDKIYLTNESGYVYSFDINQTSFSIGDVKELFYSSNISCSGINNSIQEIYLSSLECPDTAYDNFPGESVVYVTC